MTGSNYVRPLRDGRMADAAEIGRKAASLGELLAAGFRVPDGVVLTSGSVDLPEDDRRSLLRIATDDLGAGPFAVRSSGIAEDGADHSYAGIFESVLDVPADELPAAVDRVLASVRATRAAEYEHGSGGRMAVIVQRMVRPAAAGVALTADPINGDRRSCVVSAVRGVGERLVSGAALGDEWVVRDGAATARRQPERSVDRRSAVRVAQEAQRIAAARGAPQDIEWAIDGDGTTLDPPGQADDGAAARGVVGRTGARRLHPHPSTGRVDLGAGDAAVRVLAVAGDGGAPARRPPALDRAARAAAASRHGQRLVLLLHQLAVRPRSPPQPARYRPQPRPEPASGRGPGPAHGPVQRAGVRAGVARGPAAALPHGRGSCRGARRDAADHRASRAHRRACGPRRCVLRLDRRARGRGLQDGDEPRTVLSSPPGQNAGWQPPAAPGRVRAAMRSGRARRGVAGLVACTSTPWGDGDATRGGITISLSSRDGRPRRRHSRPWPRHRGDSVPSGGCWPTRSTSSRCARSRYGS